MTWCEGCTDVDKAWDLSTFYDGNLEFFDDWFDFANFFEDSKLKRFLQHGTMIQSTAIKTFVKYKHRWRFVQHPLLKYPLMFDWTRNVAGKKIEFNKKLEKIALISELYIIELGNWHSSCSSLLKWICIMYFAL